MNEKNVKIGFFNEISQDKIQFDLQNINNSNEKLQELLSTINNNRSLFENNIIIACKNKISFDFTLGSDEEDDDFFEDAIKPYLLKEMSRTEYQNIFLSLNDENYLDEIKKIVNFEGLFSNIKPLLVIRDDIFSIEIHDIYFFENPLVIYFYYNLEIERVW